VSALEIIALVEGTPQLRAPGTGDTYSAPRALALTPETLAGSAATSGLSLTQTWNTTGTPTAIKLDVTNTASNVSSLLMDLRVGGVSQAKVDRSGGLTTAGAITAPSVRWANGVLGADVSYVYTPSVAFGTGFGTDCILTRDAADTLALRRSTNAQTFNTYGTFTDSSNYRRVKLTMTTAGVASLTAEGAGTGASGNVLHISSLPTSNPGPGILWNNAGTPAIGT
jgi:hypothetical protein